MNLKDHHIKKIAKKQDICRVTSLNMMDTSVGYGIASLWKSLSFGSVREGEPNM